MKKKFTFLMAACIMLLTMFAIPMRVMGQTRTVTTTTFKSGSSYSAGMTLPYETGGLDWVTFAKPQGFESASPSRGIQYSKVSTDITTTIASASVTKVVVVASTNANANVNSLSVYVGSNQIGSTQNMPKTNNETYTFENSSGLSGEIKVSMSNDGSKSTYIKSIAVTYTIGGGTTYTVTYDCNDGTSGCPENVSNISPNTSINLASAPSKTGYTFGGWNDGTQTYAASASYTVTSDVTFTAQWTVNTHSITMPSADTYGSYSRTPNDATVAYGTEVTLTYTPAQDYANYVATWTVNNQAISGNTFTMPDENVTVGVSVAPYQQPTTVNINMNYQWLGSDNGSNLSDSQMPVNKTDDNVTTTIEEGTSQNNPRGDSDYIRLYNGNSLTFAAPQGYEMTAITFTTGGDNSWSNPTVSTGELDNKAWAGNASSVTFTLTGKCFISKATITLAAPAARYDIDYANNLTNGAFASGNPTDAAENETVTITTIPSAGYHLATMSYNYGETSVNVTVNGNTGSFTMPAEDILVYARFAENVATFTDGVYTETMTTLASFDNMTVISVTGDDWKWHFDNTSDLEGAYINGYSSGSNHANVDWMITPKMAVTNGKLDISFDYWHNYQDNQLAVKWSTSNNVNGTWNTLSFTEGNRNNWHNGESFTIETDAANVYVAFVYTGTDDASGAYRVRNFKAKQYYTITLSATNGTLTSTPAGKAAVGADVTLNPSPNTNYHFASYTVDPVSVIITNNAFTMPAENVTVSTTFEHDATYTITFVENGSETHTDDDIAGGLIGNNLPSTPYGSVPANLDFVGWSTSEIGTYQTTLPTLVDESYNVAANVTFFAVYKYDYNYTTGGGTPYWAKVTDASTLAAGDQLVIASDGDATSAVAGDINTSASNPYMVSVDAEFESSTLTALPNDAVVLTLGGTSGAWTLTNNSNQLLGATAAKKMTWGSGTTTWTISINNSENATIYNTNETYGRILYNVGSSTSDPRFDTYTSELSVSMLLPQLYRLEGGSTTVSGTYYLTSVTVHSIDVEVSNATTWTGNHSVDAFVTIKSAGKLTVGGLLINPDVDAITIEDGGQLVCNNDGVYATCNKSIVPTTETAGVADDNHWYSISSPINSVAIISGTNLVPSSSFKYNLYRYDESENEWEAYNPNSHSDFTILKNGRGYLYRNNIGDDIEFAGVVNVGNVENIALTKANRGFNLIGNPFGHNIYKGEGAAIDNIGLNDGFYYLSNMGAWEAGDCEDAIAPNTGILVQVNDDNGVNLTITDTQAAATGESRYANDKIKFIVSCGDYEDVAYAKFHKGNGLNKINHRNANAPMIYIPQDGENYAIAMMEDNTKVFGLNFKAATMGQYTLSYKADGNFNYLHVIDRLTGNDTDMLIDGEYTFVATPNDNENRFIVKLEYMPDYSEGNNEIFAYQTGSEILVSGLGELQIFDVTGRNVMTRTINGAETINGMNAGVYIFRLNEMIQKIVVR